MSTAFDPYHKWLGISPDEQPADYYRLLGIKTFESDPDVIESAADRQMAHLRTFQSGQRSDLSQKILNEIASVKLVLLSVEKKQVYDARLREKLRPAQAPPQQAPPQQSRPQLRTRAVPQAASSAAPRTRTRAPQQQSSQAFDVGAKEPARHTRQLSKRPAWQLPALVGGVAVALLMVGIFAFWPSPPADPVAQQELPPADPEESALQSDNSQPRTDKPPLESELPKPAEPDETKPQFPAEQQPSAEQPRTEQPQPASLEKTEPVEHSGPLIDLLKVVDREGQSRDGSWNFEGSVLVWNPGHRGALQIPHPLPRDYSLTMIVQRHDKYHLKNTFFTLIVDGEPAYVRVDGDPGRGSTFSGLFLDGRQYHQNTISKPGPFLSQDSPNTIVCTVRGSSIRVTCNGTTVIDWSGESERLRHPHHKIDPRYMQLNGWGIPYRVLRLELRAADDPGLTAGTPDQNPVVEKISIPDDDTQQRALQQLKEAFADDYNRARKPEEKLALATKLMETGKSETGDDSAVRYALFDEARRLASEAGEPDVAIKAVDQLVQFFDVESLELKAELLTSIGRTMRSPEQLSALIERLSMLTVKALEQDRYDVARQLTSAAVATARRARSGDLVKKFVARGREVDELDKTYEALAAARAALEKYPDDPDANLALGKFLCFVKNDWDAGLPRLAAGSDPQLKLLAAGEQSPPTAGTERAVLADSWWKLSQNQQGAAQQYAQSRASYWYAQAASVATGLTRLQAQKEVARIDALISKRITSQLPDGAILVMPFEPSTRYERDGNVFFKDYSARKRVAKLHGSAKIVAGKVGSAVDLSSHIEVSGEFPGAQAPRTLMVWLKGREFTRIQSPVGWGSAGGRMFGIRTCGKWSMARGGASQTIDVPTDTDWHHHCLMYDGQQIAYVFDGRLVLVKPMGLATVPSPMIIGARTDRGYPFNGLIDELLVFDRVLTEQEIQGLYRRGLAGRRLVK